VFRQWPGKPEGWQPGLPGYGGRPDGAAVDVEGNYYVAMFEGGRLLKLSPAGE
jgi:sugar lactone lactonase YvrE